MTEEKILGVKVDFIDLNEALNLVSSWLKKDSQRYIVTPNVEIIMAAQKDSDLKSILNDADLSIADSFRLDWAIRMLTSGTLKRAFLWPFFLFPALLSKPKEVLTGVDLMEGVCREMNEKPVKIGLIGGIDDVAEKAKDCLKKRFSNLNISFAESGGKVSMDGQANIEVINKINEAKVDILFIGLGHIKQEKWIKENRSKLKNVKVFMSIGGSLDYLSGNIARAPKFLRSIGFEWLFRLIIEPWRIRRFGSLVKFIFLVLVSAKS